MSSNFLLAGWLAFKVIDHKAYSYKFLQSTGVVYAIVRRGTTALFSVLIFCDVFHINDMFKMLQNTQCLAAASVHTKTTGNQPACHSVRQSDSQYVSQVGGFQVKWG